MFIYFAGGFRLKDFPLIFFLIPPPTHPRSPSSERLLYELIIVYILQTEHADEDDLLKHIFHQSK